MYVSVLVTAVLSVAGIAGAVNTEKKSCQGGPWVEPVRAGIPWDSAPENHYFCEAGHADGNILTGIRVWRGDWAIWGLQFQWGGGDWGATYGDITDGNQRRDPDDEQIWKPSQEVVIKLWDNKNGGSGQEGVGWVQVFVDGEKVLTQGANGDHTGDEHTFDSASKRIIALEGKTSSQAGDGSKGVIETLQFLYLESKVVSTTMTSINFAQDIQQWNAEKKNIEPKASFGSVWFANKNPEGGLNQTFSTSDTVTFENTKTLTTSNTHSVGLSFGASYKIEVGVPGVASESVEGSFEARYDFEHMESESNQVKDSWQKQYQVGSTVAGYPPQAAVHCTCTATKGTFDSDYTAEITAKLENGKSFAYKETGTFKSITYVDAETGCEQMTIADMPDDTKAESGSDVKARRHVRQFVW